MKTTRSEIVRKLARVHAILKTENLNDEAFGLCCEILNYWKENHTDANEIEAMGREADML